MAYNKKEVLQANTEAIRVVLRLEKERREAIEAEKSILRNYQGFGGLKCVLNRTDNPDDIRYWSKSEQNLFEPTQQLKQMIYTWVRDKFSMKKIPTALIFPHTLAVPLACSQRSSML